VSGASNVLGVFNDLAEISRIVHQYGARLLVDAAQLVAIARLRWNDAGLTISPSLPTKRTRHSHWGVDGSKGTAQFQSRRAGSDPIVRRRKRRGHRRVGKALVLLQRIGLDVIQEEEQALTARHCVG